jgi:hypothetical protein
VVGVTCPGLVNDLAALALAVVQEVPDWALNTIGDPDPWVDLATALVGDAVQLAAEVGELALPTVLVLVNLATEIALGLVEEYPGLLAFALETGEFALAAVTESVLPFVLETAGPVANEWLDYVGEQTDPNTAIATVTQLVATATELATVAKDAVEAYCGGDCAAAAISLANAVLAFVSDLADPAYVLPLVASVVELTLQVGGLLVEVATEVGGPVANQAAAVLLSLVQTVAATIVDAANTAPETIAELQSEVLGAASGVRGTVEELTESPVADVIEAVSGPLNTIAAAVFFAASQAPPVPSEAGDESHYEAGDEDNEVPSAPVNEQGQIDFDLYIGPGGPLPSTGGCPEFDEGDPVPGTTSHIDYLFFDPFGCPVPMRYGDSAFGAHHIRLRRASGDKNHRLDSEARKQMQMSLFRAGRLAGVNYVAYNYPFKNANGARRWRCLYVDYKPLGYYDFSRPKGVITAYSQRTSNC